MIVFVDESGTFTRGDRNPHALSGVGALLVPDAAKTELYRDFERIRVGWGETGETKGARLSDSQIDSVLEVLLSNGIVAELAVIDLATHRPGQVARHRNRQVSLLREDSGHPTLRAEILELADRLSAMNDQLYAQLCVTNELVYRVIECASLFHSVELPEALSQWEWIVDAKGARNADASQQIWSELLKPAIQYRTLQQPIPRRTDGVYEAQDRTAMPRPPWLPEPAIREPTRCWNLRFTLDNIVFRKSNEEVGLQLIDVVINSLLRTLKGRLNDRGSRRLGSLLVGGRRAVPLLELDVDRQGRRDVSERSYAASLASLRHASRAIPLLRVS